MRKTLFALALMAMLTLSGLLIEPSFAQNTNSSTTMSENSNMNMSMGRRHSRRRHRKHRKHRRHRRMHKTMNANANH